MTAKRILETPANTPAGITGADLATNISDTVSELWKHHGGVLTNYGGTATSITADCPLAITAYSAPLFCIFEPQDDCEGATEINLNGVGAVAIVRPNGDPLEASDFTAGSREIIYYDAGLSSFILSGFREQVGGVDYQEFTASGTWTKPAGVTASSRVIVEAWGAGGGGAAAGGGGGGGGYVRKEFLASALGATETITIGAGGAAGGASPTEGGNTTFGAHLTAYGGGRGGYNGGISGAGGGGGGHTSAGGSASGNTAGAGGGPFGGAAGSSSPGGDGWSGGGGGSIGQPGGNGLDGGGGGGGNGAAGGKSKNGGGGGGIAAGVSVYGGNGGSNGVAGSAPGGGGGTAAAGARGEIRVTTII